MCRVLSWVVGRVLVEALSGVVFSEQWWAGVTLSELLLGKLLLIEICHVRARGSP